jgi:hypothetical protein
MFANPPDCCCQRMATFGGYIQTNEKKILHSKIVRNDIFGGIDYATCNGFSAGAAISGVMGKMHASMDLGNGDIDGIAALVYLRKNLWTSWTIYGTVSGSALENQVHRPTLIGKVKGKNNVAAITGNLSFLYQGWCYKMFSISPRANIVYSAAFAKEFKEKGAVDALHGCNLNTSFLTGELGFSALYSRPNFAIEVMGGIEQPLLLARDHLDVYFIENPNIDYSLFLSNTINTLFNGGINLGWRIEIITLNASYKFITSGENYDYSFNAGIRICW